MGLPWYDFCSEWKVPLVKRLMNVVPRSISTAKLGTIPNRVRTHKLPKQKGVVSCCPCVVTVVWLFESWVFLRWMRWFHSKKISVLLRRLSSVSVSRRNRAVCKICEETF